MADVRVIDARWACIVVERLQRERIPLDPILKRAGLTRRQVSDPDARIPYQKHAAFLSLAEEAAGDDCLCLRLTAGITPQQAGLLGYVFLNSATLGDALANLVRYFRVLSDAMEFDLEIGKKEAAIVNRFTDPLVPDHRLVVECELSLLYRFCQLITGREIRLGRVEFEHAKPKYARIISRVFGAPVRYRRDRNALAFEAGLLDLPVEAADSELLKILLRHCELILGERPRNGGLVFDVQRLIANMLPSGQPKMDAVARELGMSSRTLTRRLAQEGLTYKGLLDEVRRKLALQYLKDKRISFKQIAYLLGYSEVAAFYHAFRRWAGASPLQYQMEA